MSSHENNAESIIEAVKDLHSSEVVPAGTTPGGRAVSLLLTPGGVSIDSLKPYLDEYLEHPERTKGTARLQTLDALIVHCDRFGTAERSALFASADRNTMRASLACVYDYDTASQPGWREHRAVYPFAFSQQWEAWAGVDGKTMELEQFAEFLEDRIEDVIDPVDAFDSVKDYAKRLGYDLAGPSKLITLSRGLSINVESRVASHSKLSSGEGQILFSEEHSGARTSDGKTVKVPGGFAITLPVFEGGDAYQIPVRLRYTLRQGGIKWTCHLSRIPEAFRDAFEGACTKAAEETGLPLFYGAPE